MSSCIDDRSAEPPDDGLEEEELWAFCEERCLAEDGEEDAACRERMRSWEELYCSEFEGGEARLIPASFVAKGSPLVSQWVCFAFDEPIEVTGSCLCERWIHGSEDCPPGS